MAYICFFTSINHLRGLFVEAGSRKLTSHGFDPALLQAWLHHDADQIASEVR